MQGEGGMHVCTRMLISDIIWTRERSVRERGALGIVRPVRRGWQERFSVFTSVESTSAQREGTGAWYHRGAVGERRRCDVTRTAEGCR